MLLILSIVIGYLLAYFINYLPQQKDININFLQKLELTWNSKKYHIHHWITFLIIILSMLIGRYTDFKSFSVLFGLLIGGILEGFLFDDWHIIRKVPKFSKTK